MTTSDIRSVLAAARSGRALSREEALSLASCDDLDRLVPSCRGPLPRRPRHARQLLEEGVHPAHAAVPRRLPLLHVRARARARASTAYLSPDEVLAIARAGAPPAARRRCSRSATSPSCAMRGARGARRARRTTRRCPTCERSRGAGAEGDRPAAAPQSRRDGRGVARPPAQGRRRRRASCWRPRPTGCRERGGPHFGSPDKRAGACASPRFEAAGRARVPFTTGILIGIGETRGRAHRGAAGAARPRTSATATSRRSSSRTSAPSPARRWPPPPEPSLDEPVLDHRRGAPDLRPGHEHPGAAQPAPRAASRSSIAAGINDWGGVSPVTPDHVNPEAPWPHLDRPRPRTPSAPAARWSSAWPLPAYAPLHRRASAEWHRRPRCTVTVLRLMRRARGSPAREALGRPG